MPEDNARALPAQEDADGGLIGAASLSPDSFPEIVRAASRDQNSLFSARAFHEKPALDRIESETKRRRL